VCAPAGQGLLLPDISPAPWPTPLAYFPLANFSLAPWPPLGGAAAAGAAGAAGAGLASANVTWAPDARFGSALRCDKENGSYVSLPPVPYAAGGGWAVNLWIKKAAAANASAGDDYEYFFSHAPPEREAGMGPNQV